MECFTLCYKVTRTVETPRSGASSHIEAKNNGQNVFRLLQMETIFSWWA